MHLSTNCALSYHNEIPAHVPTVSLALCNCPLSRRKSEAELKSHPCSRLVQAADLGLKQLRHFVRVISSDFAEGDCAQW